MNSELILRINKKGKRIVEKIIVMFVCICIGITCVSKDTYADMKDDVSETQIRDYDVVTVFKTNTLIYGNDGYYLTVDLSTVDEMNFPYSLATQICCSNINVPDTNNVGVRLNDNLIYYDPRPVFMENTRGHEAIPHTIDIRPYRTKNAKIKLEIRSTTNMCSRCKEYALTSCHIRTIEFIDHRAKVTSMDSALDLGVRGGCTITPTYSANTVRTSWGIKYAGESSFTRLNDGENANGLVVSGANSPSISISNAPNVNGGFDLGVFVYNADGNLPGGSDEYNTPFFTHISVSDKVDPTLDTKKTIDKEKKAVVVKIIGTDDCGLSDAPYSFDGGVTFGTDSERAFTEAGVVKVALKDNAGNTVFKDVVIEQSEIDKAREEDKKEEPKEDPKENEKEDKPQTDNKQDETKPIEDKKEDIKPEPEKNEDKIRDYDSIKPDFGSASSDGDKPKTEKDTSKDKGGSYVNSNAGTQGANGGETSEDKIDKLVATKGDSKFDSVTSESHAMSNKTGSVADTIKQVEQIQDSKSLNKSNDGKNKSDKDKSLSPADISEDDSKDLFEKIRKNSEEYIISMKETSKGTSNSKNNAAKDDKAVIDLETIEDESGVDYLDSANDDNGIYVPEKQKNSIWLIILFILFILLLLAILLFVLFFGVIILVEKETEYSKLSGEEGFKMPVAISFVKRRDGEYAVCFRELLDKYGVVYARFGVLFAYMYEGEKIIISTKFKGEKEREIASERIAKEIVVGTKGGAKR